MKRRLAILAAFGALTVSGFAQQSPISKGMLNPNAPIELSADETFYDEKAGTLIYTGNVIVHQGEVRMRANKMRAKLEGTKPSQIFANGRVVIDAPSGTATGDNGVYEVGPRVITLTGNVVLTQNQNVMRGQKLVVNLINGQANLAGGDGNKGRVHALFTPNGGSQSKNP